jgi:hypothetical protein
MHFFRPLHIALVSSILMAMAPLIGVANAQDGIDKKRVLLMPVERGESVLSVVPREVAESLRTILSNNRTIEILRPSDLKKPDVALVADKPKAKSKDKLLVKADKALWDAKELAGKEKYLSSAKLFKKAMSYYEKRFAKLVDFDKYVDAALGVSLSYFFAGYDDNGEDALAPVMILKPTTVLQRRKVPKAAMEALDRLRKLYSKASSGRIRIESNPPGAVVYVDGVLRGQTPTMVSGLWRGQHVMRLTRDGFNPVAKRFTASGRQQNLSANLKPIRAAAVKRKKKRGKKEQGPNQVMEAVTKAIKTGQFGNRFSNAASALAKEYGLSSIVMPYVRRSGRRYDLAAFFYDATVKRVAELEWINFAADLADMQSKLLRVEEQVLQGLVIFPRSRVVSRRKKSKIYEVFEVPTPPAPKVVAKPPVPSPGTKRGRAPAPSISPKPPSRPATVAKSPVPIRVKRPSPGRIKPVPSVSPAPPVARPAPVAPPAPAPRKDRNSEVLRPVAPPTYGSPRPVAPARPSPGGFRPTPAPVYAPSPAPVYTPRPAPVYAPRPAAAPVYAPRPAAAPVYAPRPAAAPVYAPRPAPVYAPRPAPVYAPRPSPTPVYAPRPAPAPVGAPQPMYAPKPVGSSFDPSSPAPIPDSSSMVTSPWYNKWWVWTIIGGAVVGTTGLVVGLTGGDDVPPGFRTVVTWGAP